jgi:hypothetical protein
VKDDDSEEEADTVNEQPDFLDRVAATNELDRSNTIDTNCADAVEIDLLNSNEASHSFAWSNFDEQFEYDDEEFQSRWTEMKLEFAKKKST